MRFIPFGSGGGASTAKARYAIRFRATGGTVGVIGSGLTVDCHPTMITTSNGTLLFANGYEPMKRMRPNEKRLSNAGVPAPKKPLRIATADEIAGDGSAQIPQQDYKYLHYDYSAYGRIAGRWEGTTFVYTEQGQRSADKRHEDYVILQNSLGQDETAELVSAWGTGAIRTFLGTKPATFITPDGASQPHEWGLMRFTVRIANRNSSTNPLGVSRLAYNGRYQAFMRYVDKDGLVSNPCPISTDTVLINAPYILYRDVETPVDPRVARRQIFRNKDGNSNAFWLDIDTDDLTSTDLVSYLTDQQLVLNFGQYIEDENGVNLFFLYGEPPSDKPFICEYNGCVFAVGKRVYRKGVVSVTNGSNVITGIGTKFLKSFVGRKIVIGSRQYPVASVDVALQQITIDKQYDGPTDTYATYSIEPYYGDSKQLAYTEPGYPESWAPPELWLELPEDGDDVTGLMVFANAMWILKERSIYQFTFTTNPGRDGNMQPASSRGCISQRMAVLVDNQCMMMDRLGWHVFNGEMPRVRYMSNATPNHLSLPVADMFRTEGDGLRVNFNAAKCFWSAALCMEHHVVRGYVTMQGYGLPRHAFTYDFLLDRWNTEEYPFPITAANGGKQLNGRPLLGGPDGKIYQPDLGSLDVVGPGATRLTVAEVISPYKIVLSETPPDCVGSPIAIVRGRGVRQWSTVLTQDGETIEVDLPFLVSPDTESIVQIGAIPYHIVTPTYTKAALGVSVPHGIRMEYKPATVDLEGYIQVLENGRTTRQIAATSAWGGLSATPEDKEYRMMDFSRGAGVFDYAMDSARDENVPELFNVMATIYGFSGQQKPVITSIEMYGALPAAATGGG